MSIITKYLNDNAQTPVGRFVVYMLYKQACNKHSDKSNRWSLGLNVRQHALASTIEGVIISIALSRTRLTANHRHAMETFF